MQLKLLTTMLLYKGQTVIILSHKNPDVDSIISGVLLQKLLCSLGYMAKYIIPDKAVDAESAQICLKYGINPKDYLGDVPENSILFLVDHYKTNISGNVVGSIDHHPTMEAIQYEYYMNKASASTAMLIYSLNPSTFDVDDIKRVAIANLIDTNCFSSTKSVPADKDWTIQMCKKNGFNYEELYDDGLCLTNLSNLGKASTHGEKSYLYNGSKLKSSYVQFKCITLDVLQQFIDILRQKLNQQELDMWVFITHNMAEFKTDAYLITVNGCEVIKYETVASRGSTIMPSIEKRFMA